MDSPGLETSRTPTATLQVAATPRIFLEHSSFLGCVACMYLRKAIITKHNE